MGHVAMSIELMSGLDEGQIDLSKFTEISFALVLHQIGTVLSEDIATSKIWLITRATHLFNICWLTLLFTFSMNTKQQQPKPWHQLFSGTWDMFWRLQEFFLVKWRKPYCFDSWSQPPQWKATCQTKQRICLWHTAFLPTFSPLCQIVFVWRHLRATVIVESCVVLALELTLAPP